MKRALRLHPGAFVDAYDIREYYEHQQAGLGNRFEARLNATFDDVTDHPLQFGRVWRTWRFALVEKFPFKVVFRVEPTRVYVLSVIHVRRNDRVWKARL